MTKKICCFVSFLCLYNVAWQLLSFEKQWPGPQDIPESTVLLGLNTISCAMDDHGNVVATWDKETTLGKWQVFATHYDFLSKQWTLPQAISAVEEIQCFPNVAIDKRTGNAAVVWNGSSSFLNFRVRAARYDAVSNSWSPPTSISQLGDFTVPEARVASDGTVIAVWGIANGGLGASRYSNGQWTDITLPGGQTLFPRIAMDDRGVATVVWREANIIKAARYESSGWTVPINLSSGTLPGTRPCDVAMDNQGNAIAVWIENSQVKALKYIRGAGWQNSPTNLSSNTVSPTLPSVAMAAESGDALVVWRTVAQGAVSLYNREQGSHYDNQTDSWTPIPQDYLSDITYDSETPQVVMDNEGNGTACWYRVFRGNQMIVQAIFYSKAARTWFKAEDVSSQDVNAWAPTVAMNGSSEVIVMWGFRGQGIKYNYAKNVLPYELRTIILGPGESAFTSHMDQDGSVRVGTLVEQADGTADLVEYFYDAQIDQVSSNVIQENVLQGTTYLNMIGKKTSSVVMGGSGFVRAPINSAYLLADSQEILASGPNDDVVSSLTKSQPFQMGGSGSAPYTLTFITAGSGFVRDNLENRVLKSPGSGLFLTLIAGSGYRATGITIFKVAEGDIVSYDYENGYQGASVTWDITGTVYCGYITYAGEVGVNKTLSSGFAEQPRTAPAGGGFFMYVWRESDGLNMRVKAAYYQSQTENQVAVPWDTYDIASTTSFISPVGFDATDFSFDTDDPSNATVSYFINGVQYQSRFDALNRTWSIPSAYATENITKVTKGSGFTASSASVYSSQWTISTFIAGSGYIKSNALNEFESIPVTITSPQGRTETFGIDPIAQPVDVQVGADFGGRSFYLCYVTAGSGYSVKCASGKGKMVRQPIKKQGQIVLTIFRQPTLPQQPSNAYGFQELHRYPLHADIINVLRWQAGDSIAKRFEIFADANKKQLLASIDASCPLQFCHHCRKPSVQDVYYIYAVNGSGLYSVPAIVKIPSI